MIASSSVSGLLLQAVGMAWIGLIAGSNLAYTALVAPLIVAGCGVSMAMPAAQNVVVISVDTNEIGKASGTFNMLRQIGGAFGVAILAAVFAGLGSFGSAQAFSSGFAPALGVSAALSAVGAIVGLVLPGQRQKAFVQAKAKAEIRENTPHGTSEHAPSL